MNLGCDYRSICVQTPQRKQIYIYKFLRTQHTKMSTSTSSASTAGLPSPPFIQVEGLPNLRDLGGYAVPGSKNSIRRGVIYRAGAPSSQIDDEGRSTIKSLGITHVYDLRSNPEIEKAEAAGRGGVVEFEASKRVFAPVFTDVDYSPQNLMVRFKNYQSGSPEVGPYQQIEQIARRSIAQSM
jgi:hypothetical protein